MATDPSCVSQEIHLTHLDSKRYCYHNVYDMHSLKKAFSLVSFNETSFAVLSCHFLCPFHRPCHMMSLHPSPSQPQIPILHYGSMWTAPGEPFSHEHQSAGHSDTAHTQSIGHSLRASRDAV